MGRYVAGEERVKGREEEEEEEEGLGREEIGEEP